MLTRTRSKTLPAAAPAESTSDEELLSSQSQSTPSSSLDSDPAMAVLDVSEPAEYDLPDRISQQSAAATIHIHCPTAVAQAADAIDLTDEPLAEATVGWSEAVSRSAVHVLPCEIHFNGPAAVRCYFQPARVVNPLIAAAASPSASPAAARSPTTYISTESPEDATPAAGSGLDGATDAALASSRWYTAALRGRLLTGESVALPAHTVGLVVRDSKERLQRDSSKRHRPVRPQPSQSASHSAADSERGAAEERAERLSSAATAADGEAEAGIRVDWLVDGWFTDLTLWGRDSDWKGADQSVLKRTLLDWPVIAAALHYVPPVELPTARIQLS